MNLPFTSYAPLQDYYLGVAQVNSGQEKIVLKTDLFNEAHHQPKKGGILGNIEAKERHGIEIVPEVVERAKKHVTGDLRIGDIRSLPYEDGYFDTVLDFSTLDHVPFSDLKKTLSGYRRVLKKEGVCVIVVWVSNLPSRSYGTPNPNEMQYFFNKKDLDELLKSIFTISAESTVYTDHRIGWANRDYLHQYSLI